LLIGRQAVRPVWVDEQLPAVRLHRVGVPVDFDPQANLTGFFGLAAEPGQSIAEVLSGKTSTQGALVETYVPGLYILPATRSLASTISHHAAHPDTERRLALALEGLDDDFDVVLIDCPSALGFSFWMAMHAATAYIVPLVPNFAGMRGVSELFLQINQERELHKLAPCLLGLALVNVDYRLQRHADAEAVVRGRYEKAVFQSVVRTNTHVDEAQARGMSVVDFAPRSRGAQGYRELAGEVLQRAQRRGLITL